jgi:hypothetical protein
MLMKNKKYNYSNKSVKTGFFLCLIFAINGCDGFLDEVPDNRVALNDLDKAAQVLTNAYSTASPAFTDWMSDDVGWTIGTVKRPSHLELYRWEDVTADPTEQDTPIFFWFETYDAIAHANEVLAVINELPASTDVQRARKRAIESEALLTRAYGHFMLVNLFAKHYNRQTAGSDLGIPYVSTPETVFIKTYERLSVKRVYDKIEDDLLRGLELLDDSFFANSGKYHFNRNAALAFASRFYLFKGDFIRCIDYSSQLLGANPSAFVRDLTSAEFQAASSSIQGYPQLYSSPNLPSNLLLIRKISLVQRLDFAFGPLSSFYSDLFASNPFRGTTDERENPAFVKGANALFPVRYENLFERSSLNSNTGYPYHIALAFRGEEVLLNRAEAYTIQNKLDQAIADLQVLTDNRYSGGNPVITMELLRSFFGATNDPSFTDQLVLLNYILLERRKEFIAQGMRWFDIKRYNMSVTHDLESGATIRLEPDDLRKVLQIPTTAIDVGGLEPNPR